MNAPCIFGADEGDFKNFGAATARSKTHARPALRIFPCCRQSLDWGIFFLDQTTRTLLLLHPASAAQPAPTSHWNMPAEKLKTAFQTLHFQTVPVAASTDAHFTLFLHMCFFVRNSSLAPAEFVVKHLHAAKSLAEQLLELTPLTGRTNIMHLLVANASLRAEKETFQSMTHHATVRARKRTLELHEHAACVPPLSKKSRHLQPASANAVWRCPANPLGVEALGRRVLHKPLWYNDELSGLINLAGCQTGATCGLLALNHILRSLRVAKTPIGLPLFREITDSSDTEDFDMLDLLDVAAAFGVASAPLPERRKCAGYLLHSPGHFVALAAARLGYLLCDSLLPLPYIFTADEVDQAITLFTAMQTASAHADLANQRRQGGWTGMCLWKPTP